MDVIQNLATKNGILFGTFIIPTIMAATQLILQLFFGLDDTHESFAPSSSTLGTILPSYPPMI